MKSYQCDDWKRLTGAKVEIYQRGRLIRAGIVDAVMRDNSVLWLAADGNENRALFESAEGHEVWVDPHDVKDELYSAMLCQRPPTVVVTDDKNL